MFETQSPVGFPGGTVLTFTLAQGQPAGHNLGKLRLSATTAKPPLPAPQTYGSPQMVVRGELPATNRRGMLVVTVEMKSGSNPAWLPNVGAHFSGEGKLAGERAPFQPVLGERTYPAPWQAWRTVAEPSAAPRAFELRMDTTVPPNAEWQYMLEAMLKRATEGGFQNGVRDAAYQGIDWTDWNGKPTGYEEYLADSFRFLQAVLLREPAFRAEYYRPLLGQPPLEPANDETGTPGRTR